MRSSAPAPATGTVPSGVGSCCPAPRASRPFLLRDPSPVDAPSGGFLPTNRAYAAASLPAHAGYRDGCHGRPGTCRSAGRRTRAAGRCRGTPPSPAPTTPVARRGTKGCFPRLGFASSHAGVERRALATPRWSPRGEVDEEVVEVGNSESISKDQLAHHLDGVAPSSRPDPPS